MHSEVRGKGMVTDSRLSVDPAQETNLSLPKFAGVRAPSVFRQMARVRSLFLCETVHSHTGWSDGGLTGCGPKQAREGPC